MDEARDRPEHVGDEYRGNAERKELGEPAPARAEHVQPEPDAHQLAAAEGLAEGEEGGCGAQPGDDVLRAADQDARLAPEGVGEHEHEDRCNAERREGSACVVEAVSKPAPKPFSSLPPKP